MGHFVISSTKAFTYIIESLTNRLKFMAVKALTEEVERLRKLEQEEIVSYSKHSKTDYLQLSTPSDAQTESGKLDGRTHKRRRYSRSETEDVIMPCGTDNDTGVLGESAKDMHKEAASSGALVNNQQVSGSYILQFFDQKL